jgi:methyl-accepting chemotaxis protein
MERSGPSIEIKIVLLVAAAVIVQDIVLLVMYATDTTPQMMQIVLGAIIVLALVGAAVWGNTVARAIRRLTRACFVARQGDTHVLTELPRSDELAELNTEINNLVVLLRETEAAESELGSSRRVTDGVELALPDMMRSSQELLVTLKELREGASAEVVILRKLAASLGDARGLLERAAREDEDFATAEAVAAKLNSLGTLARDLDGLADLVMDEVSRPDVDEAALARAVNGMREAARTMVSIAGEAAGPLGRWRSEAAAKAETAERLRTAAVEKGDGSRVAELMARSAAHGLGAATRLASTLRRLGVVMETYAERRRMGG